MDGLGFRPVVAVQGRTRIGAKRGYTRHFIRLRHVDHLAKPTGQEVPEIVLENSHDGTAAYRLHAGIWRFICSNGLLIASANFRTISVKHAGGRDFETCIIDATRQIVEHTLKAFETVERWKGIILPRSAQLERVEPRIGRPPSGRRRRGRTLGAEPPYPAFVGRIGSEKETFAHERRRGAGQERPACSRGAARRTRRTGRVPRD